MPGPRSAQRARAKMLSSMRTPLAQNLSKPARRRQWLIRTGYRHALALVPAATAETVEISRQNGLDRGWRDAEGRERQRARGDDIITLQHLDLVGGQRRVRQNRHEPRLQRGNAERDVDQGALSAKLLEQELHQRAQGINLGAAQLVGAAGAGGIVEAAHRCVRDIADIDRLKPAQAAAD